MNFDHMPYSNPPHFTNPWTSTSAAGSSHNLYAPSQGMNPNLGLDTMAKQRINNNVSMPSYASVPITAASAGSPHLADVFGQEELLTMSQDLLSPSRMQNTSTAYGNDVSYTTGASSAHANMLHPPPMIPWAMRQHPSDPPLPFSSSNNSRRQITRDASHNQAWPTNLRGALATPLTRVEA